MAEESSVLEDLVMNCRFCNSKLKHVFADLGKSPIANSYLKQNEINKMEPFYPLCAYVCSKCFLVQVDEFEKAKNIFKNYNFIENFHPLIGGGEFRWHFRHLSDSLTL